MRAKRFDVLAIVSLTLLVSGCATSGGAPAFEASVSVLPGTRAALLTSSLCENQRDAFDAIWFAGHLGVGTRFFMQDDGTVVRVGAGDGFDTFAEVYVTAHGGDADELIVPFSYAAFVGHFTTAHPSTPSKVYLSTCFGAKARGAAGSTSLLNQLAVRYPGGAPSFTAIDALSAPAASCALTGNGNPDLAAALNRSAPGTSDPARRAALISELLKEWVGTGGVRFPGTSKTFQQYCNDDVASDPNANLDNFIAQTDARFGARYRELIALNIGGSAFTVCGRASGVQCPQ